MRFVKLAFWNEFGACRFIVCLEFLAGNATISSERPSVVLRYPIDACRRHPSAISAARARGDRGRGPTPTGVGRGRTVSATAAAVLSVTPYSMPIPDPAVPLACHASSNARTLLANSPDYLARRIAAGSMASAIALSRTNPAICSRFSKLERTWLRRF